MPAARTALLTCSFGRVTLDAPFAVDEVASACALARTLADAGRAVTLNWTADAIEDLGDGAVLRAVAAFDADPRFVGSVAAYRLLRNADGELVVWLQVAAAGVSAARTGGRGYLLSYYPPAGRLAVCSAAPTEGLYMWGTSRLRAVDPVEGAAMVRDWSPLA